MSPYPAAQAPSHVGRWLSTPTSKLSSPVILTGGHSSLSTPTSHTPTSALVQDQLQKSGCPQIRPSDNFPPSGVSVTPGQGRGQCLLRLSTLLPEGESWRLEITLQQGTTSGPRPPLAHSPTAQLSRLLLHSQVQGCPPAQGTTMWLMLSTAEEEYGPGRPP